ncbi:MAG TPA: glycosyltransferase [Herpetosiphonaceae bacterium]
MIPRRICLIGPASNVHVQRWAEALSGRGCPVSLISTTPIAALPPTLRRLPLLTIATATAGMTPSQRVAALLRGWARVPGIVSALKPDLVHLHSLPAPAAVPFLCLLRRLVVSTWGSDVVQRDARKTRLYPYLLAHAEQLTATSRYLARVTASYLHAPRPIHVIPFGVDLDRFRPAPEPPGGYNIGTLRHLEMNYGIDVLIEAVPLMLRAVSQVQVQIGGAGSMQPMLERRIAELGIAERVRLCGRIPHQNVPALLRSLSLFVMPSRAESFGVAALEAQACGLPVVASNVGGLPEVVRDGETGLLVPPERPAALAAASIDLLRDPERRAAMGRAGREWVSQRYDWQQNVSQMLEMYAQIRLDH